MIIVIVSFSASEGAAVASMPDAFASNTPRDEWLLGLIGKYYLYNPCEPASQIA